MKCHDGNIKLPHIPLPLNHRFNVHMYADIVFLEKKTTFFSVYSMVSILFLLQVGVKLFISKNSNVCLHGGIYIYKYTYTSAD